MAMPMGILPILLVYTVEVNRGLKLNQHITFVQHGFYNHSFSTLVLESEVAGNIYHMIRCDPLIFQIPLYYSIIIIVFI